MEIFLLLLDELDDAVAVVRVLWSRLMGLLLACGLFALTIMAAMYWPLLAVLALVLVAVWAGLPTLSISLQSRFKADP